VVQIIYANRKKINYKVVIPPLFRVSSHLNFNKQVMLGDTHHALAQYTQHDVKIVLKKAGFILQADIFEHRHC
jgi:hypothetical protein